MALSMHTIYRNRLRITFTQKSSLFIAMAPTAHQSSKMKTSNETSSCIWQRLQRKSTYVHKILWTMWQQGKSSSGLKHEPEVFMSELPTDGFINSAGGTHRKKKCTLMGTNARMLLIIGASLLSTGGNTRRGSSFMTTIGTFFRHLPDFLSQKEPSIWSWWPMTNPCSTKMTIARHIGSMNMQRLWQRRRGRHNQLWSLIF